MHFTKSNVQEQYKEYSLKKYPQVKKDTYHTKSLLAITTTSTKPDLPQCPSPTSPIQVVYPCIFPTTTTTPHQHITKPHTHAPCTIPCTTQLARHHIPNPTPPNRGASGLHDTAARWSNMMYSTRSANIKKHLLLINAEYLHGLCYFKLKVGNWFFVGILSRWVRTPNPEGRTVKHDKAKFSPTIC